MTLFCSSAAWTYTYAQHELSLEGYESKAADTPQLMMEFFVHYEEETALLVMKSRSQIRSHQSLEGQVAYP
jgi:hypothetical protein